MKKIILVIVLLSTVNVAFCQNKEEYIEEKKGVFKKENVFMGGSATVSFFNGQTILHGSNVTAYQQSVSPVGFPCVTETRTCNNGVLSGTYVNTSCTVGVAPVSTTTTEQTGVLALQNKVGATHVGGKHGFFDQLVCVIANTRNDFFNSATVVTHDLCLGRFKIDCAPCFARLQQSAVDIM
jgi:hypothetical protein